MRREELARIKETAGQHAEDGGNCNEL